jgi:hypothetical protein
VVTFSLIYKTEYNHTTWVRMEDKFTEFPSNATDAV